MPRRAVRTPIAEALSLAASILLLFAALSSVPTSANAQTCGYYVDHGTAVFQGFPETWQDPDCPECDPIPLLRIDENGFANENVFFTPGTSGSCTGTYFYEDVNAVDANTLTLSSQNCEDDTVNYVWSVYNPRALGSDQTLEISSDFETRESTSGNPGLLMAFDELQSDLGGKGLVPLFPDTGTYEIRRTLTGCGDEFVAAELGLTTASRCSVSKDLSCSVDADCPATETCEVGYWAQPVRVEVDVKFQNGLLKFSNSSIDNANAITLFEYANTLTNTCDVEDHVQLAVESRGICDASDPVPSLLSYGAGFVAEECGVSNFQWQVKEDTSVVWQDIAGQTNEGLDQSVVSSLLPEAGHAVFRRFATGSTGDGPTNEMTVAVLGDLAPVVSESVQSVCVSSSGTLQDLVVSHFEDTTQNVRYQWQTRPNPFSPWTDVAGATNAVFSPPAVSAQYRARIWSGIAGLAASENVALDGTATQSSTFSLPGAVWPFDASLAIDGNTGGDVSDYPTVTDIGQSEYWWQVELDQSHRIELINVWNRTDGYGDVLTNFRVSILDEFGATVYSTDAFTGGGSPNPVVGISPADPVRGTTVRIELLEPTASDAYLSLAEVEVFGYLECGPFDTAASSVFVGPTAADYYPDLDGDGFGDTTQPVSVFCEDQPGYAPDSTPGDCDDADPEERPGQRWFTDADQDGQAPLDASYVVACTRPGAPFTTRQPGDSFDCDDGNPVLADIIQWNEDQDRDGYTSGVSKMSCARPLDFAPATETLGLDCDDDDGDEYPGRTWYPDLDGDGHGRGVQAVVACARPLDHFLAEELASTVDCNDSEPDYFNLQLWYRDDDDDGYPAFFGGAADSQIRCIPDATYVKTADELASTIETDCDDANPDRFPNQSWYPDSDGDGLGSAFIAPYFACEPVVASDVSNHRDCIDQNPDTSICEAGPDAGSALFFDVANQSGGVLTSADGSELGVFGGGDFQVEAWIRKNPSAFGQAILAKGSACAPTNAWGLNATAAGTVEAFVRGGFGEAVDLEGTTAIDDGEWHHVALRRIRDQFSIWVDSEMEAATQISSAVDVAGTRSIVVGNDAPVGGDDCVPPFLGRIDNVRIWSTQRDLGLSGPDLHRVTEGTSLGLDAYWGMDQTVTLGGPVFLVDSAQGFPLQLDAGALVASQAPIGTGDGEIDLFLGLDHPTPDLDQPDVGLQIANALPVGDDRSTVLTTRLRQVPSGTGPIATDRRLLTGAYWIVDLLGDASGLSGDFRFEFADDQVLDWMASSPSSLELYSRAGNADDEAWTFVTTASVVDAASERVRFDGVSLGDVQLAIAVPEPSIT